MKTLEESKKSALENLELLGAPPESLEMVRGAHGVVRFLVTLILAREKVRWRGVRRQVDYKAQEVLRKEVERAFIRYRSMPEDPKPTHQ